MRLQLPAISYKLFQNGGALLFGEEAAAPSPPLHADTWTLSDRHGVGQTQPTHQHMWVTHIQLGLCMLPRHTCDGNLLLQLSRLGLGSLLSVTSASPVGIPHFCKVLLWVCVARTLPRQCGQLAPRQAWLQPDTAACPFKSSRRGGGCLLSQLKDSLLHWLDELGNMTATFSQLVTPLLDSARAACAANEEH